MRAEIAKNGVLHVIPESETEAYALAQWARQSFVVVAAESSKMAVTKDDLREFWIKDLLALGVNWPPHLGERR